VKPQVQTPGLPKNKSEIKTSFNKLLYQGHRIQDEHQKTITFLYGNNKHAETEINTIYRCFKETNIIRYALKQNLY
jgi:hypothetical protein